MNARGPRHLCNVGNSCFRVHRRGLHQAFQVLNDYDDIGKFFGNDNIFLTRQIRFLFG